jgi:hypothetical protein
MFVITMVKNYILLFFSLLALFSSAQNNSCPTVLSFDQMQKLQAFQQRLENGEVILNKKAIKYVPVKIHIIGNKNGIGYYPVSFLLQTLCELNIRFIPTGFHFFLSDVVSYLNDDELYEGNSDAIWNRAGGYKDSKAVNIFFHGGGMQWCGVYFGGVDVIFIKNSCQLTDATTLTHELGHFFTLPHTFSGWEGGNTPPNIEKIDGSNCRTAGDGFCDTKADYVSVRWSCPLYSNLKDPNGVIFKPDSSIYMNYASDNCHSRFSNEQMLAMQNDLQGRNIAVPTVDLRSLPAPQKIAPLPGATNINANEVKLNWRAVPGAFAYHLQIARFGNWEYLNYDQLIYDTSAVADLFGDWPYAWRVRAITVANTCSSFGTVDTFSTHESPASINEIGNDMKGLLYPNPSEIGQTILIKTPIGTQVILCNSLGQTVTIFEPSTKAEIELKIAEAGIYFVVFKTSENTFVKRLLVQ